MGLSKDDQESVYLTCAGILHLSKVWPGPWDAWRMACVLCVWSAEVGRRGVGQNALHPHIRSGADGGASTPLLLATGHWLFGAVSCAGSGCKLPRSSEAKLFFAFVAFIHFPHLDAHESKESPPLANHWTARCTTSTDVFHISPPPPPLFVGPNFSHHKARVQAVGWFPVGDQETGPFAAPFPPQRKRDQMSD